MMTRLMGIATVVWALVLASPAAAADATYPLLGKVRPRHAREIAASPWSVGGETLDRDYAVYANYKGYLGPLGVKKIRLQAGWAKCEKKPGQYDWAWLDEVVDDALAQGVAPWLETSYGNPIYEGGGGAGLGGGLPTGDKALAAWDAWVAALVGRYRDRVVEWEIWNEPDLNKKNTAADYAVFYIRTAEIIRREQPKARLLALAIAGIGNTAYVESFLKPLAEQKKLHLVDQITVHGYPENPDSSYPTLAKLLKVVRKYDPKIPLRQGENGAPSTKTVGALSKLKTSETVQAKWDLRRMMGDLGHDMESNVFTLMELRYRGGRMDGWNTKGILKAAPDMTVERPKQAYYAVQNVTAIFDSTLGRIRDFACRSDLDQPLAAYAYKRADGACAATLWLSGKVPADANDKTPANLTLTGVKFTEPVWVDLRTGEVRAIPGDSWKAGSDGCTFRAVPLYDSPVVIAEKSLVPLAPAAPPAADATSVPQSAPPAARSAGPECVLSGLVRIAGPRQDDAIRLAMEDLARDFQAALGAKAEVRPPPEAGKGPPADIVVRLDGDLKEPESYAIDVTARGVTIRGADRLGAVYGVYRFGREFLGVDPLWFWKGRAAPADRRDRIVLPPGTVRSRRPAFRYRGWFINDEDLLTEWLPPSGKRSIDYPFYAQVISLEIAERIFEALLRCEGNLVIPASFVDLMNEPEAELVRRAVRRGLYVTQHHIEPLGVSHFGFESFWKRRGRTVRMSYASDPQASRETWTAFAERWAHLGGEQVIWQLGLRGRGDMPVWSSDKSVSADKAGEIISAAIADQWRIVRSVDKRDQPPATVTLWMEGSQLMARGSLKLPRGVTVVFADEGSSQTLQDDFRQTPRAADHTYGLYYHIAFWSRGPHLVAGTRIGKLADQLGQAIDKGDTHCAVFNVSNIREHVLGAAAGMEILRDGRSWDRKGFVGRWPARQVALPECLLELPGERLLQDGTAWVLARKLLDQLASKKTAFPKEYLPAGAATAGDFAAALDRCIQKLDALVKQADAGAADRFYTHTQPLMLRQYYACLRELALALEDRSRLAAACKDLEALLAIRSEAQAGRWVNWYRGDKKENLPALLERMRALTIDH